MPLPPRNLLSAESSPYLIQHRDNPVHWRAWSTASLNEAAELNRPILLSIGYAACHWCHVMAHESFENDTVAEVMNRLFVNIKVDREERPDLDQIFMTALQAMGEQGGWPLTMFLTPDAKPFWGGTYFPPEPRYGRPGFVQILHAVHNAWTERREAVAASAAKLNAFVSAQISPPPRLAAYQPGTLTATANAVHGLIDQEQGGIRGAPKFPNAPLLTTLWLNWLENKDTRSRDDVINTLRHMLNGGIYDHVGGGLCRYSTDADWLVPHFEKMLYDNAQLIRLCNWAYSETGRDLFRMRIEGTVGWLLREMRTAEGAFCASLNADSGGEEGQFYTWTTAEIAAVLGDRAEPFFRAYTLSTSPSWEGRPILHRIEAAEDAFPEEMASLKRLREEREKRVRPSRDDKILVDWNGLLIAAMAEAARQFGRRGWGEAAIDAYRFVCESMDTEGRLPHSILGPQRRFPGLASDYAAMINAAVSLGEFTGDRTYFTQAGSWVEQLDRWHLDEMATGYYLTASDSEDLPFRVRSDADDAVPSATAQAVEAMARLSNACGDDAMARRCAAMIDAALGRVANKSHGSVGIINAAVIAANPHKLVLVEPDDPIFVPVANRTVDPRRIDQIVRVGTEAEAIAVGGVLPDASRIGAWLCRGNICLPPINDPRELERALRGAK